MVPEDRILVGAFVSLGIVILAVLVFECVRKRASGPERVNRETTNSPDSD